MILLGLGCAISGGGIGYAITSGSPSNDDPTLSGTPASAETVTDTDSTTDTTATTAETNPATTTTTTTTTTVSTPPPPPASPAKVYFAGNNNDPKIKPADLYFGNTAPISDTSWVSWGGKVAQGNGTFMHNDCNPDCASGTVAPVKVHVTLSSRQMCDGKPTYTRLAYASGPPKNISATSTFTCG